MLLLHFAILAQTEFMNIGVMEWYNIERFSFQVEEGRYTVFADNKKITELSVGEFLYIYRVGNKIEVKSPTKKFGQFEKIYLIGKETSNSFRTTPITPEKKMRYYDDNLKVSIKSSGLRLVNNVDLENYVAGVVQAEVGPNPAPEFFKLQAILCRTYVLENLNKHEHEGFNLCDRVHCQAYYRNCSDKDIEKSSKSTRGLVIVDSDINLITAAFYSNCGGQTVNSEDVWQKSVYYLRSVKDPYCVNQPNASWSKTVSKSQWITYLNEKGRNKSGAGPPTELQAFYQNQRKSVYDVGELNIPLKTIRSDWKLKSTFFNAVPDGENVYLTGKGFGHGTGLCQEGAMKMASSGHSYPDILHFYYKDVHLVDLSALDFFREDR
jgi:stage II sporulation protein D